MKIIALTGGIASGKSTVGRRLRELGAEVIDADQLAREAVAPGSAGLSAVSERFGEDLIRPDGSLDRKALGLRVFASEEERAALNAIVHPEVQRLYAARVAAIAERDPGAVIVYEIPLLVETGRRGEWDLVVVADAPAELRVRRLVELRDLAEPEARNRVASQASDTARRAAADVIIDTSGTEEATLEQVDALWERLSG